MDTIFDPAAKTAEPCFSAAQNTGNTDNTGIAEPALRKDSASAAGGSLRPSGTEPAAAILTLIGAIFYIRLFSADEHLELYLCIFTVLFLAAAELLCRGKARRPESFLWLAGILVPCVMIVLDRQNVWDAGQSLLFMHGFFVWYVLSRSDALLDGNSGRYLPLDALNGFVLFPFGNFLMKLRVLLAGLTGAFREQRKEREKASAGRILLSLAVLLLAGFLFVKVLQLLGDAEAVFGEKLERLSEFLSLQLDWDLGELFWTLLPALPVSAYLFGLIWGGSRSSRDALEQRRLNCDGQLARLRLVPSGLWNVILTAFILLYLAFFVTEMPYYIDGFLGRLPEDQIASSYARTGFFELCRVAALNFALLWPLSRLGDRPLKEQKSGRILAALLLCESLLLAAVAASKLWLYISRFGTTGRRLQAAWLILVLSAGCVSALVTLLSGRKTFRLWLYFVAATLLGMYAF